MYFGGNGGRLVPEGGLTIGGEAIRRVDGARFLGVWVDEGIRWSEHIEKVKLKVGRLLGVLGRASAALGGESILKLYNALVQPHLQYCLLVWGDFEEGRNKVLGESLFRHQKRFLGLIAGIKGSYHSDPMFSKFGKLKINDLYKQQVRVHAWKFLNNKLPKNQISLLCKVRDAHSHNTRAAKTGLSITTQDHRSVGYRIPKEWSSLPEKLREVRSLPGFKNKSKIEFLTMYKSFTCLVHNCYVCSGEGRNVVHI